MSNKLSKSFYLNLSGAAMLATSLIISANLGMQAQAQSTASATGANPAAAGAEPAASSNAAPSASTTSSAPTPGTTSDTAGSAPAASSDIPAGVLWTAPKYAVKEVPAPTRVAVPSANRPTTGTKTGTTSPALSTANPNVQYTGYDDKEAGEFANTATLPQYLWTRQDPATKGKKADAVNTVKEMAAYNRTLVEKFVANMTVPTSATLVESSQVKYLYLVSFTIDKDGKLANINSEKSFGPFTAVNLADESENATMTGSILKAVAKCSPVKPPPAGVAPWYMLLKYEPNTGKVFVANLNSI